MLVGNEIKRSDKENQKYRRNPTSVETVAIFALSEKTNAAIASATIRDSAASVESSTRSEELAALESRGVKSCKRRCLVSKKELAQTKHSLLKVTAELEETKKEPAYE